MSIEKPDIQFNPENKSEITEKQPVSKIEVVKQDDPEHAGSLRMKLKNSYGKILDLGSFLPEGYSFRQQSPEDKDNNIYKVKIGEAVLIPPDEHRYKRGEPLAILHEIGHIHSFQNTYGKEKQLKSVITLAQLGQLLLGIGYKDVGDLEKKAESKLEKHKIYKWYFIPDSFIKKYGDLVARNERNAWAWALWQGRKLKDEGFDIFSEFKNLYELREWIAAHLISYDYEFLKDVGQGKNLYTPYSRKIRK